MKPIQFAAAGLVLALSGCGGGSDRDGGDLAEAISEAGRRLGGLSAPEFSSAALADGVKVIASNANTLALSDVVSFVDVAGLPSSFRLYMQCVRDRCIETEPITGETSEVPIDDLRADDGPIGTLSPTPIGERHGVRVAHVRASDRSEAGEAISITGYGGWMEHGSFLVSEGTIEGGDLGGARFASSQSFGVSPNTVPDVAASWSGIVAGVDMSETDTAGNLVQGHARLELELLHGAPVVDVEFTELHDLETEAAWAPLYWEDLAVTADGFTDDVSDDDYIDGRFYGPGHEEASGVFERGGLLGAFGATKEAQSE